jgi:hypothetical protein
VLNKLLEGSALSLLVARVGANNADDAFAANDFAILAKFFD